MFYSSVYCIIAINKTCNLLISSETLWKNNKLPSGAQKYLSEFDKT